MAGKVYGSDQSLTYDGAMMAVGAKAEELWINWARKHTKGVWEWRDARTHPRCQTLKIDFIIKKDRDFFGVDVKSDSKIGVTPNILVEVERIYRDGRSVDGWLLTGEARYVTYVNPTNGRAYTYELLSLRNYYLEHKEHLRKIRIDSDNEKDTYCCLLPAAAFKVNLVDLVD